MLGRYGAKLRTKNVLQTSFELHCLLVTCVQVAMIEPVFVLVAQTSFELHCLLVTCVQVAMIFGLGIKFNTFSCGVFTRSRL